MKAWSLVQPFVEDDVRLAGQEALEIGQHRLVDGEVARHEAPVLAADDPGVALLREALCEVGEDLAAVQRAPETAGVEASIGPVMCRSGSMPPPP